MKSYTKRRLRTILTYCLAWTVAFVLFAVVRGLGTEELGSLRLDFSSSVKITLTLGPIMGVFSSLTQFWMEEKFYTRISTLRFLLLRLVYVFFFILALMVAAFCIYRIYFNIEEDLFPFIFQKGGLAIYIYVLSADLLINIIRQFNLMLGQGKLSKLLLGKFYHPREEERIFMFLDLKSSTQIAEQLGHELYSSLIQDCFNDLGVVIEDQADIYQYVGDEAVLTWKLSEGIENDHCIQAFFRFKEQLKKRASHYQDVYGVVPFFKAGIHEGKVMVTEIGKYKKDIAYHGDALNTAARIQGQCNALGAELLISDDLKEQLQTDRYQLSHVGSVLLRGKQKEVDIFSVKK